MSIEAAQEVGAGILSIFKTNKVRRCILADRGTIVRELIIKSRMQ